MNKANKEMISSEHLLRSWLRIYQASLLNDKELLSKQIRSHLDMLGGTEQEEKENRARIMERLNRVDVVNKSALKMFIRRLQDQLHGVRGALS